jgi:hypothetical protein
MLSQLSNTFFLGGAMLVVAAIAAILFLAWRWGRRRDQKP